MIFLVTDIALVLTVFLWRRDTQAGQVSASPGLVGRLADAAFVPAATVTVVGLIYSALSLPLVTANLDQMTLEQLRLLESPVPVWAKAISQWMPEWYVVAGALPA